MFHASGMTSPREIGARLPGAAVPLTYGLSLTQFDEVNGVGTDVQQTIVLHGDDIQVDHAAIGLRGGRRGFPGGF